MNKPLVTPDEIRRAKTALFGPEVPTWDVEMEGKTGHTCHVYIIADTIADANEVAQKQFPELTLTMNTREV